MHFLFKKLSSSSSSAIVLFSLIAFVLFCNTNAVIKLPGNATIPAIIAFGDSIMDTGNNNHLKTLGKCNFRPYGRAFIGKKPTGRWTNGKAPTDLIAEKLRIKELVPPYLDPHLQPQDLKTSICFASGGTGYNPLTAILVELHALGARRIGVFSELPLGCMPSQRTVAGGVQRKCAEKYNRASMLFNSKLSATIDSLNKNLHNSRIVYIDVYNPLLNLIENPKNYGFHVVNKGCCGTGDREASLLCTPLTPTCKNASEYIFWDSYHPTEAAYRALISPILQKYINSFI